MRFFKLAKMALVLAVSSISSVAIAGQDGDSARGEIHYIADGEVATRAVQLSMQRDGLDSGSFTLSAGNWAISSADAFVKEKRGAKVAFIGFKDAWQMNGETTHLLFKGVKLEGSNGIVYEGTLYKASDRQLAQSGETFEDCMAHIEASGSIDDDWAIAGTFHFKRLNDVPVLP